MKKHIPWQVKIITKIILSRLPFNYRLWERIGLFKHGHMTDPGYALRVFERHFSRVDFQRKKGNYTALELGPGDSLFSAIIAHEFGADRCYMVDAGNFASLENSSYVSLVNLIKSKEMPLDIDSGSPGIPVLDLIEKCGGIYYTDGLESLKIIPDKSVDFVWSQAVLEHIRYHEFDETMNQLRRVLRTDGVCSHRVDFKDHLNGEANNLRFDSSVWESDWMAISGFYTNRIRFKEMIARFENAGFNAQVINQDRWPQLPIPRENLAKEFREVDNDDLLISGCDVILKPID